MFAIQNFLALWSFIAFLVAVQGQPQLPSSIQCDNSKATPIKREDCRDALNQFPSESNVLFWNQYVHTRSCGSCKISITKPSRPNSKFYAAVKGDAVTAFQQAIDKCGGKPSNTTIGNYVPISVLVDYGDGNKCAGSS